MEEMVYLELTFKELEKDAYLYKTFHVMDRSDVPGIVSEVVDGPIGSLGRHPLLLVDFGGIEDGIAVRAGVVVDEPLNLDGWEFTRLEGAQSLTAVHRGDYANIRDTYMEMYSAMRERGLVPENSSRELVLHMDPSRPEDTVVEIQWPIHDWTGLLAKGIEETLGPDARDQVMAGVEAIIPETSREERFEWVMAALLRLDEITDEEQRYWAVSRCADCYPAWRIERLRRVYLDTGSVDAVMEEMKGDAEWYSTPHREGALIYHTKVPYDREAWEGATDRDEKRRAYCHCALVQDRLDEVPPTYCYCGTGWVRQVWEGVLQRPIRVEVLKSLPAGDEECQFLIHLPEDVVGGDG